MAKVASANLEMVELIVTKMTEKFTESLNIMLKEFAKCLADSVTAKITAIESRLAVIETKLDTGCTPIAQAPSTPVAPSISEVVAKTIMELESQREDIQARSINVIVSGLPPVTDISDKDVFEQFCEANLTMKPRVVRTRRLGKSGGGNAPAKLCVTLDHPSSVNSVIESASILRRSQEFSRVYFNHDLTKAQAEAAYLARSSKRASRSTAPAPPLINPQPFPNVS